MKSRSLQCKVDDLLVHWLQDLYFLRSKSSPFVTAVVPGKVGFHQYPFAAKALDEKVPKLLFGNSISTQKNQALEAPILHCGVLY